jgi:hypothetical protein
LGGGTAAFNDAITAINEVEATGVTLNADFKNVVGLRAASNPEAILYSYHNRDETGNNYTMQALPFLALITGALNLDSLPYPQLQLTRAGLSRSVKVESLVQCLSKR